MVHRRRVGCLTRLPAPHTRAAGAQTLAKGNLALSNNLKSGTPVRLLRYVGEVPPERAVCAAPPDART